MRKPFYIILLIFTILCAFGGLISLLPYEGASYPSVLGYKALCTFNPASALYCFFLAGTSCFIRSTFFKFESGTAKEKLKKHLHSLIPLSLILILALGSTIWYIQVDSRYDDTTGATIVEEN